MAGSGYSNRCDMDYRRAGPDCNRCNQMGPEKEKPDCKINNKVYDRSPRQINFCIAGIRFNSGGHFVDDKRDNLASR